MSTTPPRRIVSLVPSATETLAALDLRDRIVGRTRFCVHPRPWVDSVPAVGGTKDPDLAAIAALRPDLVAVNLEENRAEHLDALARIAPLHVAFPRTVDEALADLRALGHVTGAAARAEELARRIERARADATGDDDAERDPCAARAFRFAYLIWRRPWMTVSGDTFVSSLLGELGGRNVFAAHAERYPAVTLDELAAADPDVVLLSTEPFPFEARHAAELGELAGRCHLVDGELASWHGVRLVEAFPYLAAASAAWTGRRGA